VKRHSREFSLAIAIVTLGGLLALVTPGFFSFGNIRDLTIANLPILIVALGMMLVILTGQIDISVGSQFAICSVIAGVTAKTGAGILASAAAACATGALFGAVNGALTARARIPSIVVTLATMVALRDALRWQTQGAWVQDLPSNFQAYGRSQEFGHAVAIAVATALAAAMIWGLRHLAAGRAVYATGSNAEAARLAGIEPRLVVFCVFVLTGALTGAAAFLNSVRFNQIPANAGIGMEMQVIAAVIVGGVSVNGGRGTLAGALLGVVLLGMIGPALTFLGISAYWERALQGAIILAAVAFDAVRNRQEKHAGILAARA
jgi:rhamnose transport system permease protein